MSLEVPIIISPEEYLDYYGETKAQWKREDILSCIRYTTIQLDAICDNLFKCWNETDTRSIYYRKQEEKDSIKKAFLIQTKYNLDNGNDLKQDSNFSYSSGSVNFSENKRKREEILTSVIDLLQKGRVYRSIKNVPLCGNKDLPQSINKIIEILLEVCDRRYVNLDFNNSTHLLHTYKNKHFDVLPIAELASYIDKQLYNEMRNIQNTVYTLRQNMVQMENAMKNLSNWEQAIQDLHQRTRNLEYHVNQMQGEVNDLLIRVADLENK